MSRSTTLAAVGAVLIGCSIIVGVVGSTKGQEVPTRVRGFPFVQIGKRYSNGAYDFRVTQDVGYGWVAAQSAMGHPMLVNLNQTPVLFPKDE